MVTCNHCGENLGEGDAYDLMRNHLWTCQSDQANRVKNAMAEEGIGERYGGDW